MLTGALDSEQTISQSRGSISSTGSARSWRSSDTAVREELRRTQEDLEHYKTEMAQMKAFLQVIPSCAPVECRKVCFVLNYLIHLENQFLLILVVLSSERQSFFVCLSIQQFGFMGTPGASSQFPVPPRPSFFGAPPAAPGQAPPPAPEDGPQTSHPPPPYFMWPGYYPYPAPPPPGPQVYLS